MRLSYSGAEKLMACEQKYVHHYIAKTPIDCDSSEDTFAFTFGKAFHSCHEWSMHELGYFEDKCDEYMAEAFKKEGHTPTEDDLRYLCCAVYSSLRQWQASKLRVVKCEIKIENEYLVGYIDFVAADPDSGDWWIGDLKTTSTASISTVWRLSRDPQLTLYKSFVPYVAEVCQLNPAQFKGCLYRETEKTKIKTRKAEKPMEFAKRSIANSRTIIVPVEMMSDEAVTVHSLLYTRALALEQGATPVRNYKNCLSWNRTCEFWSQCYGGRTATETQSMTENLVMYSHRTTGKESGPELREFSLQGFQLAKPNIHQQSKPEDTFGEW